MPTEPPGGENKESARKSDVSKGKQPQRVSDIERVGGKGEGTHSFSIPDHPDHSNVRGGPGGSMD